jgi:type IV pilus assembly protein PilV
MRIQSGFAMLEVLISMLIMFGVLGIAGMQMMAINNTENAHYQSRAAILASTMAANMQANKAYWAAPASLINISGAPPSLVITNSPSVYTTCLETVCSAVQMAEYDLTEFGKAIAGFLPSGSASISCPGLTSPTVCSITLTWSEKNVALNNATGAESGVLATGKVNPYTYQTLVSIQL